MVEKKKIVSSQSTDYTLRFTFKAEKEVFDIIDEIFNLYDTFDSLTDTYYKDNKDVDKGIIDYSCFQFVFDPDGKKVPIILNTKNGELDVVIVKINKYEYVINKIFEYFEF